MLFEQQDRIKNTRELTPEELEKIIERAEQIFQEYVSEEERKTKEKYEGNVSEEELKILIFEARKKIRMSGQLLGTSILEAIEAIEEIEKMKIEISIEQRAMIVQTIGDKIRLEDEREEKEKEREPR